MDRHTLRKRAVKRVNCLIASFHDNEDDSTACGSEMGADECGLENQEDGRDETRNQFAWDDDNESQNDDMENVMPLNESLCDWAVHFRVPLVVLTALLSILRVHHPSLPKDARTLLKTTTSYTIQDLAGGTYHYFGIWKVFEKSMKQIWSSIPNMHVFRLQLNIDGLPLFRSSSLQFWPVLGLLQGVTKKPVVIALFCGNSKPNCLTDYLRDLVHELQELSKGFVLQGKQCFIKLTSVICDAPARAFVKGTKTHTGYSGCDKCIQKGVYLKHRMTFPEVNSPQRTDRSFEQMSDEEHHVINSPLTGAGIGMVSGFPHDYMHLVCLGVVRRLLDLWFTTGPLSCRLSFRQMEQISRKLVDSRPFIPLDFARKPRTLSERLKWKATELRQFLLYTGPVFLLNEVSSSVYNNFMLFSVAIFILASPSSSATLHDFAYKLLVSFVTHFSELYGPEFVTYNVHGLIHLPDDVKLHGHLDSISGFPFEDYLGKLKKMVRTSHHPLAQVIRRISEMDRFTDNEASQDKRECHREHNRGPVPSSLVEVVQFEELLISDTRIKISSEGDRCVKIGDRVALIENIVKSLGKIYLVFREYEMMEPFFEYPLNSQMLGIYVVGKMSPQLKFTELHGHIKKYVRLPYYDNFVAVPLLHMRY